MVGDVEDSNTVGLRQEERKQGDKYRNLYSSRLVILIL